MPELQAPCCGRNLFLSAFSSRRARGDTLSRLESAELGCFRAKSARDILFSIHPSGLATYCVVIYYSGAHVVDSEWTTHSK